MGFEIENGVLLKYKEEDGVTDVVIPDGVTSIGTYAFYKCRLITSVTIPYGVTSIGNDAFSFCYGLQSVTISESVTRIGEDAFNDCISLKSIKIPESVTIIASGAFENCKNLASINIPAGIKFIGGLDIIEGTELLRKKRAENPLIIISNILIDGRRCSGDVVIPDGTISIGSWAFANCNWITSITIPDSVISILTMAFNFCSGLKSITIKSKDASITIPISGYPNTDDIEKILAFMRNETDQKDTILDVLEKFLHKFIVAFYLLKKYNNESAKDFFRLNIEELVCFFTDDNDVETITDILSFGFVTKENIDDMIEYAIISNKPEIQVILSNYKNDNFGFDNGLEKLML